MIETRFKRSEVGLIPADWEVKTLSEVCNFQNGFAFKSEKFSKYGNPIIRISNIRDGEIDDSNMAYFLNGDYNENLDHYKIKKGSIVIAMSGATTGKVGISRSDITYYMNQRVGMFRPLQQLNNLYLYHVLHSQTLSLYQLAEGCAQPNISSKAILEFSFVVPQNITEQSRIAKALSDIDDFIATTKKLIEKKCNIKEGAMQDLLSGKRRIQKFKTDNKLKQTPIGFIPCNWEIDKIGEQFEFLPNNTLPREEMSDNGVVQNIHYGDVLIKFGSIVDVQKDDVPYISNPNFNPNYLIKDGDVIIADTAEDETVGKAIEIINVGDKKIVSGLHTMWLHPIIKNRYVLGFLGYAFNSHIFHTQLLPLMQGTKVTSVSKNAIQDTFLIVPPKPEQEAIVSTLSSMDVEIQSLESRLLKYQSLKQGMMQQLLTGKIRLI